LKQNTTFQLQLELSKQIERHSQHLNWMKFSGSILAPHSYSCVFDCPRVLTRGDFVQIFSKFQNQTLYDPFGDTDLQPGSAQWFQAYTFYLTCFREQVCSWTCFSGLRLSPFRLTLLQATIIY